MNEENQDQIAQEADELQEERESEVEKEAKTDDAKADDIEAKLQECEDKYLRAYADFENIKKRLEREKYTAVEYASEKFAKELLPVIDTLEMALKVEDKEQFDKFKEGVELTLNKLVYVFEKHEIMQISHEEGFDPNVHEAIMQDSSDEHDDGEIIQVLQQGYRFRERVLRPSLVKINKK